MFKRQHYITFGFVLVVVLVVLNLPERASARLKLAIGGFFLPLFGIAGAAQGLAEQVATSIAPRNKLLAEIERLRRENQQLQAQLIPALDAARENAQLRQSLGWQKRVPWQLRLARVVGQDPANWWRSILIDAGSREGVRANMVVLVPEGLVGRVVEAGFDRSRVLLVGDPNCRFSAQVLQPAGERAVVAKGIVSPSVASFDRLMADLLYLPGGSLVRPGQTVVTSGDGGVFPKGLTVGQIVDVRTNDYGMNLEARVKLAVNLNQLENVWVLTQ
jgi:rod shape-determining protein MreC